MNNNLAAFFVTGLLVLLSGCAEQPVSTVQLETERSPVTVEQPEPEVSDSKHSASLAQAQQLLQDRQLLPAASILRELAGSKLSTSEEWQARLLQTELLYLQGNEPAALAALEGSIGQHPPSEPLQLERVQQWQLQLTLNSRGPLSSARLAHTQLAPDQSEQRRQQLMQFIWLQLSRCPTTALQTELHKVTGKNWRAWLELALLAAQVNDSPDVQVAQIQLWQERYPEHPLATQLPGGLALLSSLQQDAPSHVTLLLPLSGPLELSGRAVLDGFLASAYRARLEGWPAMQTSVLDVNAFESLQAAYEQAVANQADVVIGPLAPEHFSQWQPAQLDTPLLALTWFDSPGPLPWQLMVSAEDEATQLAQLAFASGARHALLLRPEGDWGERISAGLLQRWHALEGSTEATAVYSGQNDYSSSLKAALNLAASEQRASRMRQIMGEQIEFSPRRREDIDVVFLLAQRPQDARSIKPLLAFHYAGDLPVYSTSQIYSGRPDPQRDKDLNGIRTLETPWNLSADGTLRRALRESGADESFADMHALGADAFMLHWRMQQMTAGENNRIRGQTGLLHMDTAGRVHRELVPAVISRGVPKKVAQGAPQAR